MWLRSYRKITFKDVGWVWQTEAVKALNTLLSPTTPFRLWSERMLDDRSASEVEPGQGQELKRTYDASFGAAAEGKACDTDDSGKVGEDSLPEGTVEKGSI